MDNFTCKIDGCNATKYEALGMCRLHYRRSRPRKPDAKIEIPCDACGKSVLKEKRARRYATVQCSDPLCRKWLTHGTASSCELPPEHWAIMYGATSEWPESAPAAAATYGPVQKSPHVCAWCGETFLSHQSTALYCSVQCTKRRSRKIRRAREYNAPGYFTWTQVAAMWMAFDKSCAYCHEPTALGDVEAEHVQPLSRNGRNDIGNILPSCRACNSDKRDLLLSEWNPDRARRGLAPVTTSWTYDDERYRHVVLPTARVPRYAKSLARIA